MRHVRVFDWIADPAQQRHPSYGQIAPGQATFRFAYSSRFVRWCCFYVYQHVLMFVPGAASPLMIWLQSAHSPVTLLSSVLTISTALNNGLLSACSSFPAFESSLLPCETGSTSPPSHREGLHLTPRKSAMIRFPITWLHHQLQTSLSSRKPCGGGSNE